MRRRRPPSNPLPLSLSLSLSACACAHVCVCACVCARTPLKRSDTHRVPAAGGAGPTGLGGRGRGGGGGGSGCSSAARAAGTAAAGDGDVGGDGGAGLAHSGCGRGGVCCESAGGALQLKGGRLREWQESKRERGRAFLREWSLHSCLVVVRPFALPLSLHTLRPSIPSSPSPPCLAAASLAACPAWAALPRPWAACPAAGLPRAIIRSTTSCWASIAPPRKRS